MRLAILSDVHANLIALDAALQDIARRGVDGFACLGDMIQGGPQPSETVQRLRELDCPIVMGNSDAWLLTGTMTGTENFSEQQLEKLEASRQWSLAQLSMAEREFIAGFSPTIEVKLDDDHGLFGFHGSPTDFDQFIFPTTPEKEFQELLLPYADRILAGGHIHLQHVRRISNSFFFNPGSVGVAYHHEQDEADFHLDPWAEYALLTVDAGRVGLEFRRVPFDVAQLVRVYRASGRPGIEASIAQYRGVA